MLAVAYDKSGDRENRDAALATVQERAPSDPTPLYWKTRLDYEGRRIDEAAVHETIARLRSNPNHELSDSLARELEALRHAAQAPKAPQADKPPDADPQLTEITALLHSLQQDISGLTRALQPVIDTFAQIQEVGRERTAEDAPAPEVSRWQTLTCWWRGHEENVTDFTTERYEPYTRCVNCGRVYRR